MKILKKILLTFLILFIISNLWLYKTEYKIYVENAPNNLKEARKELVKAYMIHIYYGFFVKTIGIDFQNKFLTPIKDFRNYFYYKGLEKLPKDEAERAIWFSMFEVNLYNYSVDGRYGDLSRRYGTSFSKKFINDLYVNIEILSKYTFRDTETDISKTALEDYLDFINIYLIDFNFNKNKYLYSKNVFIEISINKKLYKQLLNIYKWKNQILNYYKNNKLTQYETVLSKERGWYSPHIKNHYKTMVLSSFILFYKIEQNIFECTKDRKYFLSIYNSKKELQTYAKKINVSKKVLKKLNNRISYLHINNKSKKESVVSKNPLNLTINCDTN